MKRGTAIGALDELLAEIRVGDEVQDAEGTTYTIDRNGWCRPLDGGSSRSLQKVGPVTITRKWDAGAGKFKEDAKTGKVEPVKNEEETNLEVIARAVKDAGDQTLVDELRARGWNVICEKLIEKIVYETVQL